MTTTIIGKTSSIINHNGKENTCDSHSLTTIKGESFYAKKHLTSFSEQPNSENQPVDLCLVCTKSMVFFIKDFIVLEN